MPREDIAKWHACGFATIFHPAELRRFRHTETDEDADHDENSAAPGRATAIPSSGSPLRAIARQLQRPALRAACRSVCLPAANCQRTIFVSRVHAPRPSAWRTACSPPNDSPWATRSSVEKHGGPYPDLGIGRKAANEHGRGALHDQADRQHGLAAQPVAEMAEYDSADRPDEVPAANAPKTASVPTVGSKVGKNSLLKTSAVAVP